MTIYALASQFRRQLLVQEMKTQRKLAEAYAQAFSGAQREIDTLTRKIADAKRSGEPITRSWLEKLDRLTRVRAQLALSSDQFARNATLLISGSQRDAIETARRHADELVATGREELALPQTFARANLEAIQQLVGHLGDGSPLQATIAGYGTETAIEINRALIEGVALGKNPRVLGRELKDELGVPAVRAATTARTETLRAYNGATIENYRVNDDVIEGWQWLATLDARTCALCWAMHGTLHKLSEDFGSHPNCRCTPIPAIIGHTNRMESGEVKFARQPEEVQREILGPKTLELYRSGAITLSDVVSVEDDPQWGPSLRRRTLDELTELPLKRAA